MGKIRIEQMEFYAYHGHYKEEQIVGNRFLLDLEIETDMTRPAQTDNLEDAVNYQEAYRIIREEMKQETRELYGLDPNSLKVPPMNLEKDVLAWGERIILGEQKRCMRGGSPIYSPSIALVKVHYESFKDAFHFQKILQNNTNRASQRVQDMRDEADKIIQQLWNEVEEKFAALPSEMRREKAEQYGLIYVYRQSELKRLEAEKLQTNLNFN